MPGAVYRHLLRGRNGPVARVDAKGPDGTTSTRSGARLIEPMLARPGDHVHGKFRQPASPVRPLIQAPDSPDEGDRPARQTPDSPDYPGLGATRPAPASAIDEVRSARLFRSQARRGPGRGRSLLDRAESRSSSFPCP